MAEIYSSLFKGLVHVTTPYSSTHPALDLGNYKTRNPIYSPNITGSGRVTKQTNSYTYGGKTYYNTLTQWIAYDNGFGSCTVHGSSADKILNVGDRVEVGQLCYRTGNTGYSFGDHLHFELRLNGKLVDPSKYILDDKNIMAFKIGDKIEFTGEQNMRKGSGTSYAITGSTAVGMLSIIEDGPRVADGYTWYDLNNGDWVADVGKFKLYVAPVEPPQPPQPTECEKEVLRLGKEVEELKLDKTILEAEVDKVVRELTEERNNISVLQIKYDALQENFTRVEKERGEWELKCGELKLQLENAQTGFIKKVLDAIGEWLGRIVG